MFNFIYSFLIGMKLIQDKKMEYYIRLNKQKQLIVIIRQIQHLTFMSLIIISKVIRLPGLRY